MVPKKTGGVIIYVDMREPNKPIRRERHIMPTSDDLIADLNGSTVFSKLDLTNQNTIDELLGNTPGARNLSDNIIVQGKNMFMVEYDASLQATTKK